MLNPMPTMSRTAAHVRCLRHISSAYRIGCRMISAASENRAAHGGETGTLPLRRETRDELKDQAAHPLVVAREHALHLGHGDRWYRGIVIQSDIVVGHERYVDVTEFQLGCKYHLGV